MKQLYRFYFCHILPTIGGWISGNKGAYTYLPESVMKFPQGETFLQIMRDCGFQHPVLAETELRYRQLVCRRKMIFSSVKNGKLPNLPKV